MRPGGCGQVSGKKAAAAAKGGGAVGATYRYTHNGRQIRVYDRIDTRLMFSDMEAKLEALAKKQN